MSIEEKERRKRSDDIYALREARKSVDVSTVPIDGDLHDWVKVLAGSRGGHIIWGRIYNDTKMRFPDGRTIHTSLIVKIEDGIALTLNSAYRLIDNKEENNDD